MNGNVILVTALSLRPGFEESLLPELAPVIETTRELAGCLSFDLYRLTQDRTTLVLQETWETPELHKAYALSPLRAELTRLLARFLTAPMRTWEVDELC